MFIIWGSKRTERKLGYVADFCPICRQTSTFQLVRIGMAAHIDYISLGQGKLVAHHIRCNDCGLALSVDPLRYRCIGKNRPPHLYFLISATFPTLNAVYADRLALETQIKRTPSVLSPEERAGFIIEPFCLLNPQVEELFERETPMDKQSGMGCLGTILISVTLFVISTKMRMPMQDKVLLAATVCLCAGTIYTFIQLGLGQGRFLRAKIIPMLARSLDPLEPTQEELFLCLEKCKTAQMKIGQKIKLKVLLKELQRCAAIAP